MVCKSEMIKKRGNRARGGEGDDIITEQNLS